MILRALAKDPKCAAARAEYAFYNIIRILGGWSTDAAFLHKAESEVRQALRDDPGCGRAHSVLALIYLLQGRKELVPAELDQALKENAADPTAHSWWLQYHRFNGDYRQAREQANWLLHQWPLYWPGHLNLGELLRDQGDAAAAIRELEQVLKQDPQNVYALAAMARAHIDSGDLSKARQILDGARDEDRENYLLRLQHALMLALEDRKAEASQIMNAELQRYAETLIFGSTSTAEFYAVMGEIERALEWLERAVRMGDDREQYLRRNPLLTNLRGHSRFQQIIDSVAYRR
jgi:eukaryotic-like serine/threonine-protein kinase